MNNIERGLLVASTVLTSLAIPAAANAEQLHRGQKGADIAAQAKEKAQEALKKAKAKVQQAQNHGGGSLPTGSASVGPETARVAVSTTSARSESSTTTQPATWSIAESSVGQVDKRDGKVPAADLPADRIIQVCLNGKTGEMPFSGIVEYWFNNHKFAAGQTLIEIQRDITLENFNNRFAIDEDLNCLLQAEIAAAKVQAAAFEADQSAKAATEAANQEGHANETSNESEGEAIKQIDSEDDGFNEEERAALEAEQQAAEEARAKILAEAEAAAKAQAESANSTDQEASAPAERTETVVVEVPTATATVVLSLPATVVSTLASYTPIPTATAIPTPRPFVQAPTSIVVTPVTIDLGRFAGRVPLVQSARADGQNAKEVVDKGGKQLPFDVTTASLGVASLFGAFGGVRFVGYLRRRFSN